MSCFDADRFDGLSGNYWDFRYNNPDDEPTPPRGDTLHMSYSSVGDGQPKRDEDHVWFDHNNTSGSDYSGSTVERSNYEVLLEKAQELDQDPNEVPDDCRPFYVVLSGGHGTFAIVFHVERTPTEIVEMLEGLENYPVLDDDHHSNLEREAENDAWDDWVAGDYRKALAKEGERVFGFEIDMDDVTDGDLAEHFYENSDGAGEYWRHENGGGGPYIDVDRVAEYALSSDDESDLPKGAKIVRRRFATKDAWDEDDSFDGVKSGGLMDLPSFRRRR